MNRWLNTTKEERTEEMRRIAKIRHAKRDPKERKAHATFMANKRWQKLSTDIPLQA